MNLIYIVTDLFYLSVVIVDLSWVHSLFLYAGSSCLFWYRVRACLIPNLFFVLETSATLLAIFVTLGFSVHYLKRSLFYQRLLLEESSANWMGFLQAVPDPIAIISDKQDLLFLNDDGKRIS